MLLYRNVMNTINNLEQDLLFDVEADNHWYEIIYENNQLIIFQNNEYRYDSDNWGEISTKINKNKIKTFNCSIQEFNDFVIYFFHQKIEYIEHKYPYTNENIMKIDIVRWL